jgi:hypothetical protein
MHTILTQISRDTVERLRANISASAHPVSLPITEAI